MSSPQRVKKLAFMACSSDGICKQTAWKIAIDIFCQYLTKICRNRQQKKIKLNLKKNYAQDNELLLSVCGGGVAGKDKTVAV